jgi:hypothetical protein
MRILLISLVCFSLLACGCRKNRNNSNGLIGVWLLTETSHIGSPWTTLPAAEQQKFEFRNDSTYVFTPAMISSSTGCTGTFKTHEELLKINWTCQAPAYEILTMYTINGNEMLLDYVATSSGFKAKYVRQ